MYFKCAAIHIVYVQCTKHQKYISVWAFNGRVPVRKTDMLDILLTETLGVIISFIVYRIM